MHTNKIAIIIRNDLPVWQKLNVTAFLAGAIAIDFPELHGGRLVTAPGNSYMPFFKQPVLVYSADNNEQMQRAFKRAKERGLAIGIYPYVLFATMNEGDNLKAVAACHDDEHNLAGLAFYGDAKQVSKAIDGLKYHN